MTVDSWISLVSGLIGAVIGALLTAVMWYFQDRTARRREWIAKHLKDTYLTLVKATTYPDFGDGQSYEKKILLAEVINDIGLLGSLDVINIGRNIAEKMKRSESTEEWVSYEDLLIALRNQLRRELGLKETDLKLMMHVRRIEPTKQDEGE